MGYQILIVEDDQWIAESLSEMLEVLNHDVVSVVDSYDAAITMLEEVKVEIALLDIQIRGEKTGIDLAEKIKNDYHIPFIFTTAYADKETIKKASVQSPYGYLVKPYGMKDISVSFDFAIENHRFISGITG
ncbi:response regulator [Reichenbachiella versicolor]|uniref:response regulator n=1 Tax=Reichenbachiella versicolor TaxID=1821036 RepID=UPI0013A5B62C|nr:response regulator [Reichenbachiella versicolor]